MTTSAVLGIPYISNQQDQPDVTHNDAIAMIQMILATGVWQIGLNTPPSNPVNGDAYIVGTSPTGVFANRQNCVAGYFQDQWYFVPGNDSNGTPITMGEQQVGLKVWSRPDNDFYVWKDVGSPSVLGWDATGFGGGGGGGSGLDSVQEDGIEVVAAPTILNFTGSGVTVADAGANTADVLIAQSSLEGIFAPAQINQVNIDNITVSTSAFAAKGNSYDVFENIVVTRVTAYIGADGSATYKCVLAKVTDNDTTDPIEQILGESNTINAPASVDSWKSFEFTPTIAVASGWKLAVIVVRTDGAATAVNEVSFPGSLSVNDSLGPDISHSNSVRYASNDPTVSDNTFFDATFGVSMCVFYLNESQIGTVAGTGLQVSDGGSPETVTNTSYIDFIGPDVTVTALGAGFAQVSVTPPYDLGFFFAGSPTNGQEVFRMQAVRAFTIPDGAPGSNAIARVESTGTAVFSLRRNGAQFATVTFSAGSPTIYEGVFAYDVAADEVFAEDDVFTIIAPSTADASLADISIFLKGVRS